MVKIVSFPLWNQLFASGAKRKAAQGAEQGDQLASLLCGCAIADFMIAALTDIQNRKGPTKPLSCFGFWLWVAACGAAAPACACDAVDDAADAADAADASDAADDFFTKSAACARGSRKALGRALLNRAKTRRNG